VELVEEAASSLPVRQYFRSPRSTPTSAPALFGSTSDVGVGGMGVEGVALSSLLHLYCQSKPLRMALSSLAMEAGCGAASTGRDFVFLVAVPWNHGIRLGSSPTAMRDALRMNIPIYIKPTTTIAMGRCRRHGTWLDRAPH